MYLNNCDDKLKQGEVFINHDQGTNIIVDCTFGFQGEGKLTRFSIFISLWLSYSTRNFSGQYKIRSNVLCITTTLKQLKGCFKGMKRILIILVLPLLTVEGTSLERHQIQKVLEMFIIINL